MTPYDEAHKLLHKIALPGPRRLRHARWYKIYGDGDNTISHEFGLSFYSDDAPGPQCFIHHLKQLTGAACLLCSIVLPKLHRRSAERSYQIFDNNTYTISRGLEVIGYFTGPSGAEAFIRNLKRLVGAHDER